MGNANCPGSTVTGGTPKPSFCKRPTSSGDCCASPEFYAGLAKSAQSVPYVDDRTQIEFITDVEGNWDYVINFVSRSKVLYWEGETRGVWGPGVLRVRENCILVFGGDAPDKGPGDIRIVKTLLRLKRDFPAQVFFIIGNRDLMKLRFLAELAPGEENTPWIPPWERNPQTYEQFLEKNVKLTTGPVSKCRWMLHCNMGCQDTTFDTRKDELAILYGYEAATDLDVVQSYLDSVDPMSEDPWMLWMLRLGVVGLVLGDTLFVHGGLQDESAGCLPESGRMCDDLHEWLKELNAWKDKELLDYTDKPYWRYEGETRSRAAEKLIEYGTPAAGNRTVIYFNPFVDGNPVQRSEKVQLFLKNAGINRMLTGHQPHGTSPTVVRHTYTKLLAITADTSRSDSNAIKVINPANNRGNAVAVVRIQGPWVFMDAEAVGGRKLRFKLNVDPNLDALPDALVGRQLTDDSWVKGVVADEDEKDQKVLAALGRGFVVEVQEMAQRKACLRLKQEYGYGDDAFAVTLRDLSAECLLEAATSEEELGHDPFQPVPMKRSFTFNQDDFLKAENYMFAFNGVVTSAGLGTSALQTIIDNINNLIDAKKRIVFITNDSTMSRQMFFQKITKDFKIRLDSPEHTSRCFTPSSSHGLSHEQLEDAMQSRSVITSAYTCAWYLSKVGIRRPFVICSGKGLLDELKLAGITDYFATVDENGNRKAEFLKDVSMDNILNIMKEAGERDAVVVGWDHQLTALSIAVASQFISWSEDLREKGRERIPVISCSMDAGGILGRTDTQYPHKSFHDLKVRAVGNGTMARAVCSAVNFEECTPIDVGKPSLMLIEHLRRQPEEGGLGINLSKAVVVGDGLETDMRFASRGGMKSLLVLSGVTQRDRVDKADPDCLPTWILPSFADLRPH